MINILSEDIAAFIIQYHMVSILWLVVYFIFSPLLFVLFVFSSVKRMLRKRRSGKDQRPLFLPSRTSMSLQDLTEREIKTKNEAGKDQPVGAW